MIRRFLLGLLLSITAAVTAQEVVPGKPASKPASGELKTTQEQASYAIGLNIGRNLKRDGLEISSEPLVQGLLDALKGSKAKLTDEQCRAALEALDRELQKTMAEKNKIVGEKNKKEGPPFLAANKKKPGVVVLPSGLQYTVLKSGQGPSPTDNDTVRAHYTGTFIDGKVFDSSVPGGEPALLQVGGNLIRAFTEALKKMKVGDKWRLVVPPELAYGPDGFPPDIGPHAVLVFELELVKIEPKQ